MEMEEWLKESNQEPKNEAKMTELRATENYPQALKPNQGTMLEFARLHFKTGLDQWIFVTFYWFISPFLTISVLPL